MQVAALLWQIRELTGTPNPLALGGVGLARFLPLMIFSLIGGTVADTLNRRWIIFISQSIMAIVAAILAYLTFAGTITIWNIYLLTAIQASAIAFDIPARQALIPNIVAREDLPSAFSMTSIAHNTAAIIGPALGGIVIATLGQGYTYLFNSISFMAVLIALLLIGPVVQDASKASGVSLTAVLDGMRFHHFKTDYFIHDDPGFLCHLFRICQHHDAHRCQGYPECRRGRLRVACFG